MLELGQDLGFVHERSGETIASLCDKVDEAGGWNPDAVCVQFYHGDRRYCVFSHQNYNTGWWTTVLTRDEYYWQRISAATKDKFRKEIAYEMRQRIY